MNAAQAETLCRKLSFGTVKVRFVPETVRVPQRNAFGRLEWLEAVGGSIVISGGSHGEHELDLICSSEERVIAHWRGYCEANGVTPEPTRYEVVVTGVCSANDGWESSHQLVTGWVSVEAAPDASERTIRGLARQQKDSACWEQDGNVRFLRTMTINVEGE
jgi:hypothetical protein